MSIGMVRSASRILGRVHITVLYRSAYAGAAPADFEVNVEFKIQLVDRCNWSAIIKFVYHPRDSNIINAFMKVQDEAVLGLSLKFTRLMWPFDRV